MSALNTLSALSVLSALSEVTVLSTLRELSTLLNSTVSALSEMNALSTMSASMKVHSYTNTYCDHSSSRKLQWNLWLLFFNDDLALGTVFNQWIGFDTNYFLRYFFTRILTRGTAISNIFPQIPFSLIFCTHEKLLVSGVPVG